MGQIDVCKILLDVAEVTLGNCCMEGCVDREGVLCCITGGMNTQSFLDLDWMNWLVSGAVNHLNEYASTVSLFVLMHAPDLDAETQEIVHQVRKQMLDLEEFIPWNAVSKAWKSRRPGWRKTVRSTERISELAERLKDLLSTLVWEKSWKAAHGGRAWENEVEMIVKGKFRLEDLITHIILYSTCLIQLVPHGISKERVNVDYFIVSFHVCT